ncbi:MAG: DedA family protein [Candidatus Paceibacterales bacterium]
MTNIIAKLSGIALSLIGSTGYAGIFLLSALESCAIPIPSEVVVPFSGFLAVSGRFNLWAVIAVATIANLVGAAILFWVGRSGGRWILERYGKYIFIHGEDLEKGDKWFKKYGDWAIFWSRMLPVARTYVSLAAGVAGMNFYTFSLYTLIGSLPWNAAQAIIGYKAGENWMVLEKYFRKLDILIVAVIVVLVVVYLWKHLKKRQ